MRLKCSSFAVGLGPVGSGAFVSDACDRAFRMKAASVSVVSSGRIFGVEVAGVVIDCVVDELIAAKQPRVL